MDLTFQLDFTAPADLRRQLKFLPHAVRPKDDGFILSDRKDQIQDAIEAEREGEESVSPPQSKSASRPWAPPPS